MTEPYSYDPDKDPWTWRMADPSDLTDLVDLTETFFQHEIDQIYTPDRAYYTYKLGQAIWSQTNLQGQELITVARNTDQVLAYGWATSTIECLWSRERTVEARIVHIRPEITARQRVRLCSQIIQHWQRWAQIIQAQIIVSSTIRSDQAAFLRLHEQQGFIRRGSIAYKKL